MEIVHEIIIGLARLVPHDPNTLIALAGSGAVTAVALQVIKHFGKLEEAKKTVTFLLGALGTVVSLAGDALQLAPSQAGVVFGEQVGAVIGFAVVIHRFAVSPLYYKIIALLEKLQKIFTDAKAYREEMAPTSSVPEASAVPATAPHEFSLGL